jgi:integration host factor subunit alpha
VLKFSFIREGVMTGKTVTRADLSEAVHNEIGLSRSESAQLIETVLGEISDALVGGEDVKLSSFGSFIVRQKNGRIGRNPKTGEEVPIDPRRVLTFRASHVLKEKINKLAGLSS